jgi:hypothetical protein
MGKSIVPTQIQFLEGLQVDHAARELNLLEQVIPNKQYFELGQVSDALGKPGDFVVIKEQRFEHWKTANFLGKGFETVGGKLQRLELWQVADFDRKLGKGIATQMDRRELRKLADAIRDIRQVSQFDSPNRPISLILPS